MFEDITKGVKNEAAVLGQVLHDAPGAVWDEIKNDWNNHRGKLLAKEGISLAVGLGTGIALSRSPFLVKGVLGALFSYQAFELGQSSLGVMGRAWNADSEASRQALAKEATSGLSKAGANVLETTPAFMAGGGTGMFAGSRFGVGRALAFDVREGINNPPEYYSQQMGDALGRVSRNLVPSSLSERFAWTGPGTRQLPAELMSADGKINIFEVSKRLADLHTSTEESRLVPVGNGRFARAIDQREQWAALRLSDMKVSRSQVGDDLGVKMPFPDREGRLTFHTHPPEGMSATYPVAGARPSIQDLKATVDTGIIQSGPITTIYQGAAREFGASQVNIREPFQPNLRALFFDRDRQLAAELTTKWQADLNNYQPALVRLVDYQEAVKVLSNWDRQWSSIAAIPNDFNVASNLANPGVFEFLKLGLYKSAGS